MARRSPPRPAPDPLWYKDAVIYELRVPSFYDSDGDGIGDFRGLTEKLDYLADLGVDAIWLLPFYPSPMRDDGYDIADYRSVHPDCGTLDDFRTFLAEAHRRDLRVITELVINHTSDQHPWFQRARRSPPGSRWRDFYVWSDTPDRYTEARIIFRDFEPSNWSWDPLAEAYYWHRFYHHQPDLNFDNPEVRREVFRILDFWLAMGVDGMRLDAVPYLFEREGTNCENLPETHAFLRELRAHVDRRYRARMLLAEANQWPEDAAAYFGRADECHMAFHFPIMPRLFMALHMEDRFPVLDILAQTPEIPTTCQWALFLRNHDELTLEMVTDEERDYMYRVYAHDARARINLGIRRRLAPLLGRDRRRIELMNALLFSLPGTPIVYYGDEIGMGDNFYLGDRNGVRTPMQWSADRNAGFSRANPQKLFLPVIIDPEYHYESVNVETQQANPHSLLWWMKRMIALRKRYRAFGRGSMEILTPANHKVLAFVRRHEEERILVVANLSRFVQFVELDLAAYRGMRAVELFGHTVFPRIGDLPYLLTLGPHAFYWFSLEPEAVPELAPAAPEAPPLLQVDESWERVFDDPEPLEAALCAWLPTRRWYGRKSQSPRRLRIAEVCLCGEGAERFAVALVENPEVGSTGELYLVPMGFASGLAAAERRRWHPGTVIARLEIRTAGRRTSGVLYDAAEQPGFANTLLGLVRRGSSLPFGNGTLVGEATRALRGLLPEEPPEPHPLGADQSNTSVAWGEALVLKLYRRPAPGPNPEVEMTRFLTERARFAHVPAVAGVVEKRARGAEPLSLALLQQYVPNEGDAWHFTVDRVRACFEHVLTRRLAPEEVPVPQAGPLELAGQKAPALLGEVIGAYLDFAALIGRRTAELHAALGRADSEEFRPEPFGTLYQRSLYQSLRNLTLRSLGRLRAAAARLQGAPAELARQVLEAEPRILEVFRSLVGRRIAASRIRIHGDYHLGQLLYTGRDLVIIDFEGEPARAPGERRLKRSPLVDVAGMLRSFAYAAHAPILGPEHRGEFRESDMPVLRRWAAFWERWVCSAFLRAYLGRGRHRQLLPASPEELSMLLRVFLIEKNVYEIAYEVDHRPDWMEIPATAILEALGT